MAIRSEPLSQATCIIDRYTHAAGYRENGSTLADRTICGLCGQDGAEKKAAANHWPGEQIPDKPMVHSKCEWDEAFRAHEALSEYERDEYLRSL